MLSFILLVVVAFCLYADSQSQTPMIWPKLKEAWPKVKALWTYITTPTPPAK